MRVRSKIATVFWSKLSHIIVAMIGAGLLIFTVQRVGGWPAVVGNTSVGWWFIFVVLLAAVRIASRARAWVLCAADPQLRFRDAFGAILAGDAAGNLTPLGVLASEPTKILMSRSRISTVSSIASVAIENAFYIASVGIVLLAGTWIFLQRADVPAGLEQISEAILVVMAIAAIAGIWAARTRPAVLSRLAPLVTRLAGDRTRRRTPFAKSNHESTAHCNGPYADAASGRIDGALSRSRRRRSLGRITAAARRRAASHVVDAFLMESAGRFVTDGL